MTSTQTLETERLKLRQLKTTDAAFIFRLLNEPSWLQFIGDRNIHCLEDAKNHISDIYIKAYQETGFGLLLVSLKKDDTAIGLCGLIKRDGLKDIDLGFAFLPEYWGSGYAKESSLAVLSQGKLLHKLNTVIAITLAENHSSKNLLKTLGFKFIELFYMKDESEELELYKLQF